MNRKIIILVLIMLLTGQGLAWALQPALHPCRQGKCHHGAGHYMVLAQTAPELGRPCCCPAPAAACNLTGTWCPIQPTRALRTSWRWHGPGAPVLLDSSPRLATSREAFVQAERSRDPGPLYLSTRVLLI